MANVYAEAFVKLMEERDFHVGMQELDSNGLTLVTGGFGMKHTTVRIAAFFEDDDVHLTVKDFLKVTDDQYAQALVACNTLNSEKRWVKFYIDDDMDVVIDVDAVLALETAAEEAFTLLLRTITIADEAYPVINKAIWA